MIIRVKLEIILYGNGQVTIMEARTIQGVIVIGLILGAIGLGYYMGSIPEPNMQQEIVVLQDTLIEKEADISNLTAYIQTLETYIDTLEKIKNECEEISFLKDNLISLLEIKVEQLESEVESLHTELLKLQSSMNLTLVAVSFSRTEDTSALLQYWLGRANETVRLMVMLITQDELADALIATYSRGVDVDIIIDSDWLNSTGSDYQQILDAGIDIRGDDRSGLMHHKVLIIDGYVVVMGSYNWSAAAEDRNDENLIILNSEVLAQTYLEEFNRLWEQT